MSSEPGYGENLDVLVASAIAEGEPIRSFPYNDSYLSVAVLNGRLDLAKDLIEAGAKITIRDFHTILYWSGEISKIDFMAKFYSLMHKDYEGLLESALYRSRWNLLREFLRRGADANMSMSYEPNNWHGTKHSVTLLHVAAFNGAGEAVECLLLNGAEVDRRDFEEMTPLMKVCNFRKVNHQGNVESASWLLDYGADPNALTPKRESPLLLCIGEDFSLDRRPETPKIRANIAGLLLRYGADPNILSPAKTTPLMLAARDNNAPLARKLLDGGANPTIKSPTGKTALNVAIERQSKEVQAILEAA